MSARAPITVGLAAAVAVALCVCSGCAALGGVEKAPVDTTKVGVATRDQLLRQLQIEMAGRTSVKVKAEVELIDQATLVPASATDAARKKLGRAYKKDFLRTGGVNGYLLLSRAPDGRPNVRFSGQITAPSASFSLVGRGNDFWVLMPDIAFSEERAPDGKRGTAYTGTLADTGIRPAETFSYRPQDIAHVFLYDEVLNPDMLVFMETWPRFYVLTFLRDDWPEHVCSKIWVNRETGAVGIRQIYDASGAVVVEARFEGYARHRIEGVSAPVSFPRRVTIVWPRDRFVMKADLSNIRLNEPVAAELFSITPPADYRVMRLRTDEKGNLIKE